MLSLIILVSAFIKRMTGYKILPRSPLKGTWQLLLKVILKSIRSTFSFGKRSVRVW